ncbi:MAG: hypothetical protein PVF58_05555 [Candidatus Methanofastidiosia archaeon]
MVSILIENILRETSNTISIIVKIILAYYFFRRYSQTKLRIPLIWGAGFLLSAISQIPVVAMRSFQDPTTNMAFAVMASSTVALAFVFLYYGTALLYFKKDSFMRERLSIIMLVLMMGTILMFPFVMSAETVLKSMFVIVTVGFIHPTTLLMALIFFMIWHRLNPENPRKPNVLIVGIAWFSYSLQCLLTSVFFGKQFDWIFYIIAALIFLMLFYGMIFGKATEH